MTRATKSITLALISSSLLLAGCKRDLPPVEEDSESGGSYSATTNGTHHTTHSHHHGPIFIPLPMGGGYSTVNRSTTPSGGATGHSTASSTSRGGFGSTGAAATHGSTGS